MPRDIPFIRILAPFCAGIVSGLYLEPGAGKIILLLLLAVTLIIITFRFNRLPVNYYYGPPLFLSLFLAGLALYSAEKRNISVLEPANTLFTGTAGDFPEKKSNSFLLPVRLEKASLNGRISSIRGSILLYLTGNDSTLLTIRPGDKITFRAVPLEISNRNNPYEFDYRSYMERRHTRYYAFAGTGSMFSISNPDTRNIREIALIIRKKMIDYYRSRGITGDNLAIAAAITLGEKDLLEPELRQDFIKSGTIHVMAVSGLHVGILSLFVFNLLFFLKQRLKILRAVLVITILWGFAFITGLAPSVMRATLMFSLIQAGLLMKRDVSNINLVLASAFIILVIRPSVLFDAGFLLSYSAVIPIIAYYKGLYSKLSFKSRIIDRVWQIACVTLIAQAGTFPLTVMLFNRFPLYFLLTNMLIVPLASLIVIAGCLAWLTIPAGPLSALVTGILEKLTGLTLFMTSRAASLPGSSIENIGLSTAECILLMIAVIATVHFIVNRESLSIRWPLILFILFFTVRITSILAMSKTGELIVYSSGSNTVTGIRSGRRLDVITDLDSLPREVIRHSSAAGLKPVYNHLDNVPVSIRTGDTRILICPDLKDLRSVSDSADFIIISGSGPFGNEGSGIIPGDHSEIIFSQASEYAVTGRGHSWSSVDNIWIVRKSGAYRKTLGSNRKIKAEKT